MLRVKGIRATTTGITRIQESESVMPTLRRQLKFGKFEVVSLLGPLAMLILFQNAFAQWEFDVVADLGIVYTDNLRLAPADMAEEDIVYTIIPTFALTKESERLTADLRYRPEAYFYDDAPESDAIYHVVDASLTSTLVRDALFVYVSGAQFQTTGSPEDGFPTSNLPITGNRVDSTKLEFRPYWEQNLGFADILAELAYRDSRYDADEELQTGFIQHNTERNGRFSLNNHSHQEGLAWGLGYDYRRVEYDQALPFEFQTASVDLGYWLNGTTRVFVSGGVETPFNSYFDPAMEDDFWEAGIQYTPNQRLDIEFAAGERSFGDTYRGRLSYELRRGRTEFTYEDGVETRGGIGSGYRPIVFSDNLDTVLDRPGESDRFIRKRGEWQTTIELAKSDISFRLFSEDREQRTADTGVPVEDERLAGAAFRWAWRLGTNSTLGLGTDFAIREVGVDDSDLTRFSFDYAFRFSQRLSVVLLLQHSEETGEASFRGDHTENQYRLNLRADL